MSENKSAWENMSAKKLKDTMSFCDKYIDFLNTAKTERLAAKYIIESAVQKGFKDFQKVIDGKIKYKAGDKYFYNVHDKSVILVIAGSKDPANGFNIVGSHIDAPRLDFKPSPITENEGFALGKTHYYGGIKKYQWTTIPLEMHGVVFTKTGKKVEIAIGNKESDPVFTITDLLPHLAQEQMTKSSDKIVQGEDLAILLGSMPLKNEKTDAVKAFILDYLKKEYKIEEKDFGRAEIEIVPAMQAKNVGLDRSFVGAYGQDDRVCAYTSLQAILSISEIPERTLACYFSDKEEVGSMGVTGARGYVFRNFALELCNAYKNKDAELRARRSLQNSYMLSADVTAGFDPLYASAYDKTNCSYIGAGVALEKYTGHRGKSDGSDANAEYMAKVSLILDSEKIPYQITEMGRVDLGGGGTIAQYMADLGVQIVDCGTPILSMHSPYEVSSKADVYSTFETYKAFLKKCK